MDLEPAVRPALLGLDAPPHPRREHLGPAARQRPLARLPQALEHVDDRQAADVGDRVDLGGGKEVRCHLREAPSRLAHERGVVVERQRRVVAALQQHRRSAARRRELDLGQDFVDRQCVRLRIAGLAVERAELAVRDADIRVVRVRVDHERDDLFREAPEPRLGRQRPQLEQRRVGEEPAALRPIEPLAVEKCVANPFNH